MSPRRSRVAWCLYDFANSSFTTVVVTAVYVMYFGGVVARGRRDADFLWGLAVSASMAVVALSSPVLGAVADLGGGRRRFLAAYTLLCAAPCALLFFPREGDLLLALVLFGAANVGFEGGYVFYNAWLPELAPPERQGRLSGHAWATGYLGGMIALALALALVRADAVEWTWPMIGAFFVAFALPALAWLPETRGARLSPAVVRAGFARLHETLRAARAHRDALVFLVAFFLYNDAIVTIIAFATRFSTEALAFTQQEAIVLILVVNVTGAVGAVAFGHAADRVGARRALQATLVVWIVVCVGALVVRTKPGFWVVANLAGVSIGSSQALSRTVMASLAPRDRVAQFFGLQAFCGRASAVVGPSLFGALASTFGHRAAVLSPLVFFVAGLAVLLRVREPDPAAGP